MTGGLSLNGLLAPCVPALCLLLPSTTKSDGCEFRLRCWTLADGFWNSKPLYSSQVCAGPSCSRDMNQVHRCRHARHARHDVTALPRPGPYCCSCAAAVVGLLVLLNLTGVRVARGAWRVARLTLPLTAPEVSVNEGPATPLLINTMIRSDPNRIDPKRRNTVDYKKKQFANATFKQQEYRHRLNFYQLPPTAEITLEQFEQWAIDRLRSVYIDRLHYTSLTILIHLPSTSPCRARSVFFSQQNARRNNRAYYSPPTEVAATFRQHIVLYP